MEGTKKFFKLFCLFCFLLILCLISVRMTNIQKDNKFIIKHFNFILFLFFNLFHFFKDFIYLLLERGREGEKHQCAVASCASLTGDLICNSGMCPRLGIKSVTF